ncbi:hypothetical protein PMIN04_002817 [Paraphaeosphaeria minitans]
MTAEDRRSAPPMYNRGSEDQDQKTRRPEDQKTRRPEDQRTRGPEDRDTRTKEIKTPGCEKTRKQNTIAQLEEVSRQCHAKMLHVAKLSR